jgi:hypothetical protein
MPDSAAIRLLDLIQSHRVTAVIYVAAICVLLAIFFREARLRFRASLNWKNFLLFAAIGYWRRRTRWTLRRHAPAAAAVPASSSQASSGASPWGVAAMVAVLLVMVSFQPSVHAMWFRPLWGSDYDS